MAQQRLSQFQSQPRVHAQTAAQAYPTYRIPGQHLQATGQPPRASLITNNVGNYLVDYGGARCAARNLIVRFLPDLDWTQLLLENMVEELGDALSDLNIVTKEANGPATKRIQDLSLALGALCADGFHTLNMCRDFIDHPTTGPNEVIADLKGWIATFEQRLRKGCSLVPAELETMSEKRRKFSRT